MRKKNFCFYVKKREITHDQQKKKLNYMFNKEKKIKTQKLGIGITIKKIQKALS